MNVQTVVNSELRLEQINNKLQFTYPQRTSSARVYKFLGMRGALVPTIIGALISSIIGELLPSNIGALVPSTIEASVPNITGVYAPCRDIFPTKVYGYGWGYG